MRDWTKNVDEILIPNELVNDFRDSHYADYYLDLRKVIWWKPWTWKRCWILKKKNIEDILMDDMARQMAEGIDDQVIKGLKAEEPREPTDKEKRDDHFKKAMSKTGFSVREV